MRRLVVYPLPKNMGPGESEGRRAARARALLLQHKNDEGAVYVDVAKVKNKDAYVAAAVAATTGKIVTSCSVRTRSASQAEEMAIALAARSPGVRTILSDSKTAIRSFSRGAVCGAAARALASDESKLYPRCPDVATVSDAAIANGTSKFHRSREVNGQSAPYQTRLTGLHRYKTRVRMQCCKANSRRRQRGEPKPMMRSFMKPKSQDGVARPGRCRGVWHWQELAGAKNAGPEQAPR
ncbi:hypothetical protein MRX96_042230 [Rhipicephalus microplus]